MSSIPAGQSSATSRVVTVPRVIVATTAMLTFISFWRAGRFFTEESLFGGADRKRFLVSFGMTNRDPFRSHSSLRH